VVAVVVVVAATIAGNNLTGSHVMRCLKSSVLQEFSEKLPKYSVDMPLAKRKEYSYKMTTFTFWLR
jgi:hypothetical protein